MSTATKTLNVGAWLDETQERHATTRRRLDALGWTEATLDALLAGTPVADLLDARGEWLRGGA